MHQRDVKKDEKQCCSLINGKVIVNKSGAAIIESQVISILRCERTSDKRRRRKEEEEAQNAERHRHRVKERRERQAGKKRERK